MDEIVLTQDGVHITKQIDVMGSPKTFEEDLSYDELNENHDLRLDIEEIRSDSDEDGEFIVHITLNSDGSASRSGTSGTSGEVPDVPEVPLDDIKENRQPFYRRLSNPERQPYTTRRIIYEAGELTERELKRRLHESGHTGVEPGKQNGSVAATLVVLDEVTKEIEREGRGEDKTLRWVEAE